MDGSGGRVSVWARPLAVHVSWSSLSQRYIYSCDSSDSSQVLCWCVVEVALSYPLE